MTGVPSEEAESNDWSVLARALLELEIALHRDDSVAVREARHRAAMAEGAFAAVLDGDSPLVAVAAAAELRPVDVRVLAVCAAVEVDGQLQQLVGALRGNSSLTRPDLDLLMRLLGVASLGALSPDAPLRRAELIEVQDGVPLAAAQVGVPRSVIWSLLGDMSLDPELPLGTALAVAPPSAPGTHELVLVHGEDRTRRVEAAIRATLGLAFLVCPPPADDRGWQVLTRQASVGGLGIVLELDGTVTPTARFWIERASHLAFALSSTELLSLDDLPGRPFAEVEAAAAASDDHEWNDVFPGTRLPKRRPTAEQLRLARLVAATAAGPLEALRRVASGTLLKHATRITPKVGWDELILPSGQERRLRDLVDRYRYRGVVHDEWGLPLYPSPGVVTLFSGPSGTGKTTTAEVLAGELGVDMFRVDLSALVSKYIGETEKNLEEIFSAAHAGDYLLLFDEADSLFGTRSKVSDARDRYANMEVSYLLQRLETYDGFVVLTSNFQGNIDQAFLRRIHVTVHFAVPSVEDRARIWERSLGNAPREDLDVGFVAEQFDLTGGSIRNAALTAAFFAAASARAVTMVDVLRAVSQEMVKLGRRPNDDQFGRWLNDLKD